MTVQLIAVNALSWSCSAPFNRLLAKPPIMDFHLFILPSPSQSFRTLLPPAGPWLAFSPSPPFYLPTDLHRARELFPGRPYSKYGTFSCGSLSRSESPTQTPPEDNYDRHNDPSQLEDCHFIAALRHAAKTMRGSSNAARH